MKKLILFGFMLMNAIVHAQLVSQLKFDKSVPDAENNYVAVPREDKKNYGFGFIYFDEVAGYTYRNLGSLNDENGVLRYIENEDSKTGFHIQRIGNLAFKSAIVPQEMLKQFKVPMEPDWLKNYKSTASENEKQLNRASSINGAQALKLALPVLQKLYASGYRSTKLFFEFAFAHNALGDFANGEKLSKEGIDTKMYDDNVYKEYVFALVFQNKIMEADQFLTKNLSNYKNKTAKVESIGNLIAFTAQKKQVNIAKKWFETFKKEAIGSKYDKNIAVLDKLIKDNDSTFK